MCKNLRSISYYEFEHTMLWTQNGVGPKTYVC